VPRLGSDAAPPRGRFPDYHRWLQSHGTHANLRPIRGQTDEAEELGIVQVSLGFDSEMPVQLTSALEPPLGVGQLRPTGEADIDVRAISYEIAEYFLKAAGESEPDCHGVRHIVYGFADGRNLLEHDPAQAEEQLADCRVVTRQKLKKLGIGFSDRFDCITRAASFAAISQTKISATGSASPPKAVSLEPHA
jgi:hypothetical protein